jgi:hypothetical protein
MNSLHASLESVSELPVAKRSEVGVITGAKEKEVFSMKRFNLLAAMASALVIISTPSNAADDRTPARAGAAGLRGDVDKLARDINVLDEQPAARRAGLTAIARETASPLSRIEQEHNDNPRVGLSGLFIAHQLAARTGKPMKTFIQDRQAGKTWAELSQANGLDLNTLENSLVRIQSAMQNPSSVSDTASRGTEDRVRNRDRAARRAARSGLEQSAMAVNDLGKSPSAMRSGLAAVSKETAVPLPTIEEQQRAHPNVGLGDLFVAQELAVQTQKSVGEMLRLHSGGQTWNEIVAMNNKDIGTIQAKLDRIEDSLQPGASTTATSEERVRVRERGARRTAVTELERRVAAVNSLDDQPAALRAGLTAASRETATPLPTIEQRQKQHVNVGLGDFFVAQELATKTQKSVEELLNLHASGQSWNEIAAAHNQDVEPIRNKLSNVEQAMRDAR